MINTRSAIHASLISKQHIDKIYEHDKGRTDVSDICMKDSRISNTGLIELGAQILTQTVPAAPLLTPLSGQSSPSSSFFLDQAIDAAAKQAHKTYEPKDVSSLSWLDDGDEEADDISIDEGRPPEKSHWSDDSDVDDEEYIEDQTNDEHSFGESVLSADDVELKGKETDEQVLEVKEKEDMKAAVTVKEINGEVAELSGKTYVENDRRLKRVPRRDGITTQVIDIDMPE